MSDPRSLLQKADKVAASATGGFSFFGGRTEKLEGAADLYVQAANAFRVQRQGREAGQTFEKAAAIQRQLNEPDDAANTLVEAFKSYKKDEPADAARCLEQAIKHYTSKGSFRRAATHQQNLAELYELDLGDMKKAIEAYELAGDWFSGDNAEALANKVYLKVADLAALEKLYGKAIEHYEQVAKASANNNLMRWSLKDYFLKAGLCHLAENDMIATRRAFEAYVDLDPSFAATREYQLLMEIAEAIDNGDSEVFEDKVFQYDQLSKLDKWKTTILLRVKDTIQAEDFA
ncbi:soluble NSF attachment protein [Peziza echinospora]|nr:soluble NSF attachment protein [Peziza echinospora]